MIFRETVQRVFGQDALDWLDRSYAIDWIIVIGIGLLSWAASTLPVFERSFDIKDPLINHPHGSSQVSSVLNQNIAFLVPILLMVIVGGARRSLIEIHHGIISVLAARGLARLVTVLLKHGIGRLRPDFLDRCQWDEVLNACSGSTKSILDGRRSFPSGHSSTAFSGMTVLSFWLAGKTAAWCFHVRKPSATLLSSRMGNLTLTLLPFFWASFVAVSRVEDYKHHREDVVVGSLIGIICGVLSYLLFWPNPFSKENFARGHCGQPRMLYLMDECGRPGVDFRLTRVEDDVSEDV